MSRRELPTARVGGGGEKDFVVEVGGENLCVKARLLWVAGLDRDEAAGAGRQRITRALGEKLCECSKVAAEAG